MASQNLCQGRRYQRPLCNIATSSDSESQAADWMDRNRMGDRSRLVLDAEYGTAGDQGSAIKALPRGATCSGTA